MKRTSLLLIALSFVIGSKAQSQRLELMEEFTQASCPPCAAQNPSFNVLLDNNLNKAVSIKYQTVWPGVDSMNQDNQAQVATRVNYYSVTGVPTAKLDGGAGFSGSPGNCTQNSITNRYSAPAPFTIDVSFTLSPAHDSIYCHSHIVATQTVTGAFVAHTVVIERKVYWPRNTYLPGTNGERVFEGVMKQMLPSDAGFDMNDTITSGDAFDLNYAWKLANVYDTNQLGVVVFIQNNTNKQIQQTGYAAPHIGNDAGVYSIELPSVQCGTDVQPAVDIRNYSGLSPLTSFDLIYNLDNGPDQTINFSGSIAPSSDTSLLLPVMTLPSGGHTFAFRTANPNAAIDQDTHNDNSGASVAIYATGIPIPISQNFGLAAFPPPDFAVQNVDRDDYTWIRAAAGHGIAGSAKMDDYHAAEGTIDYLYVPKFDFSSAITGSSLTFDVAHAQYDATVIDRLRVNVSTDCGAHFINVYNKGGSALATGPIATSSFTPNNSQWRTETISLNQFIGSPDLLVQFESVSGYGNNVYVDNINIMDAPLAVSDPLLNRTVEMYPNPAQSEINLDFALPKSADVNVTIFNSLGAVVKTENYSSLSLDKKKIDISSLAEGTYNVNINANGAVITKRLAVTK